MKLKSLIFYQCLSSLKAVCIYFMIVYGIITIGNLCLLAITGSLDEIVFNGIEMSSFIFLYIMGSLGFQEDFKMAIQNGFTRKYIVISGIVMLTALAALIGAVDTIAGNIIVRIIPKYQTMFQAIYGMDANLLMQWLYITLLYFSMAILAYVVSLICNRIGIKTFLLVASVLVLSFFVITPIFIPTFWQSIADFVIKVMGFTTTSTINYLYPISFFSGIIVFLLASACLMMKRIELK